MQEGGVQGDMFIGLYKCDICQGFINPQSLLNAVEDSVF